MGMSPAEFAQKWKGSAAKERAASQEHFIDVADRVLVVVHANEGDTIRIISAGPATKRERHDYAEL